MFQGIPGIERAANGRLWATWYGGGAGEGRHNYVMLVTSGDDGRSWSGLKLVIDPDRDGPCRAFDPCLWHDPKGRLWLFWAQSQGSEYLWAIATEDSGSEDPKWSAPRPVHPGIMMNKPTVIAGGAWLLPVAAWGHDGSSGVVCSTDEGATWQRLGQANIPKRSDRQCDEHMIVERTDGSLWMLVRTNYGIGQSVSMDRGKTWSDVERGAIQHAVSRFFIRRLRSGKLLLVKHNAIDKGGARSLLNAFLSDDDGKTWKGGLMLDERNGVSYPDAVESPEGVVYVIYDYMRTRDKQILMATFTEADVAAGKCVSAAARFRVVVNQATGK
jgi:predicted neuraminidase